ncbi:cleavage and polyadenylation specificity factor subunit 2 [Rhizophlyctis rosea]|nr:cleavage and polyadenylation specificity factor subunit 2 [Rhizophlyctis rosea]
MSAYIKFTPLSGARDEDPLCYLLEIDEAKILLDCGWTDRWDVEDLVQLRRIAKTIDAVLLSHADIPHIGAYPYAVAHLGLTCPSYSTTPVHDMGQIAFYDAWQSTVDVREFDLFDVENINGAFEKMVPLRYSQPYSLGGEFGREVFGVLGKCKGITISAYAAGHTIGGAIWKIKKDTDEIVYAVDYNHRKEGHLNGTVFMSTEALARPSVLITDAYNALNVKGETRKARDAALIETLTSAMSRSSNVLIPVDSTTRVLELAYLLEQHWAMNRISYPLVLLTHQSPRTAVLARSMLEWMGDFVSQAFGQRREVPFDFQYLKTLTKLVEVQRIHGAKIVLASLPSLDSGYANTLFREWCADPENVVVLPDRGAVGSLSRSLFDGWDSERKRREGGEGGTGDGMEVDGDGESGGGGGGGGGGSGGTSMDIDTPQPPNPLAYHLNLSLPTRIYIRTPLEGDDLTAYLHHQQQLLQQQQSTIQPDSLSDLESESDDEDGDLGDRTNKDLIHLSERVFDVYVKDSIRSGGFFKGSQTYRMYPVPDYRKRVDDYGEVIDSLIYERGEYSVAGREEEAGEEEARQKEREKVTVEVDLTPSSFRVEEGVLDVRCWVVYVDFEGRSDGGFVRHCLPMVAPRKVILVHGNEEATEELRRYCLENESMTNDVFAPGVGEVVNVSAATDIYQVKLTDPLVSSLRFATPPNSDYSLAYLSGVITSTPTITSPTTPTPLSTHSSLPILDLPPGGPAQIPFHTPLLVGDIKLSAFRQVLQDEGFETEFVGGALVVDGGKVVVRRVGRGRVRVEGVVGREFWRVRGLVYGGVAVL